MKINLTTGQIIAIILAVLGVLSASTVQLTELMGPALAKTIATTSTLSMTILSSILAAITGQASQLQAVAAMPGVDRIVVNERANDTLATLAVDPKQEKIESSAAATQAVVQTAKDAE